MYVRLAFAVAAHMEPQILLVDEVLAVGDQRFWQKSTDKMHELNARGMTIVLVTHNMWLIQTVCTRGILLQRGTYCGRGAAATRHRGVPSRRRVIGTKNPRATDAAVGEEGYHFESSTSAGRRMGVGARSDPRSSGVRLNICRLCPGPSRA